MAVVQQITSGGLANIVAEGMQDTNDIAVPYRTISYLLDVLEPLHSNPQLMSASGGIKTNWSKVFIRKFLGRGQSLRAE